MRDRWSRSRATFRNTYPSRPVATDASRATPDCGLDDRHAPPRSFGIGVAPHAGTAGEQASSMPPSSTSAGCGRIDGTPETSRRTRHTPTPTRRSPVFDPKTGHGGRRGAEYRPHEPRLPPRPSWKTRCPRQESSRVFVYFEAAIVADERATRPVSADLSSDPGSGDLGGSGVHLGRCQHSRAYRHTVEGVPENELIVAENGFKTLGQGQPVPCRSGHGGTPEPRRPSGVLLVVAVYAACGSAPWARVFLADDRGGFESGWGPAWSAELPGDLETWGEILLTSSMPHSPMRPARTIPLR